MDSSPAFARPGLQMTKPSPFIEVFDTGRTDTRMVRSNFMIAEFRGFETRCLYGCCGHRYVRQDGAWKIAARQLNLIDCDQCIRNPSIVL